MSAGGFGAIYPFERKTTLAERERCAMTPVEGEKKSDICRLNDLTNVVGGGGGGKKEKRRGKKVPWYSTVHVEFFLLSPILSST